MHLNCFSGSRGDINLWLRLIWLFFSWKDNNAVFFVHNIESSKISNMSFQHRTPTPRAKFSRVQPSNKKLNCMMDKSSLDWSSIKHFEHQQSCKGYHYGKDITKTAFPLSWVIFVWSFNMFFPCELSTKVTPLIHQVSLHQPSEDG